MKILILSWYFPPANDVAALRVGRLAEYLQDAGHEVWVMTGDRRHPDNSLSTTFPESRVIRTPWFDVTRLPFAGKNGTARPTVHEQMEAAAAPKRRILSLKLTELLANLLQIPDRYIGWLPHLLRAGRDFLKTHEMDLIYVSGPPFTAFLAANRLSRRFSVPWIAEYRDGWSRYLYAPRPPWRQAIDEMIENRLTARASGIVTVTQPWAEHYRARFGRPATAVYNGVDPDMVMSSVARAADREAPVSIVYMGGLYEGLRDPSILYQAIRMSQLRPDELRLRYYGPSHVEVIPLAKRFGVGAFVELQDRVPYHESLLIQRQGDVLLLLQSPFDPRNVPAKLFEYLASGRPILGVGLDEGIPARIIRERRAGFYVSDPAAIAEQLKTWVAEKKATGTIADIPASAIRGLSRRDQFRRLEQFLESILVCAPADTAKPVHDISQIMTPSNTPRPSAPHSSPYSRPSAGKEPGG